MYCQKCRTPLKLHGSVENLNPASFQLLADQPPPPEGADASFRSAGSQQQKQLYDQVSRRSASPVFRRGAQPATPDDDTPSQPPSPSAGRDRSGMSFVNITDSQVVPTSIAHKANPQTHSRKTSRGQRLRERQKQDGDGEEDGRLSRKMQTSARLFDILSSRSDVDHPVCVECTDALVEQMEKRLATATRERDAYVDFLRNVHADAPTAEEAAATRAELAATKQREEAALRELEGLERDKAALEAEVAELEAESAALDADEAAFWRERNDFTASLAAFRAERDGVNVRYDHDARLLERLRRTDVYTDAFYISYDGGFGTINGLRLGRLARPEVDWSEVNAAWGMALLFLDTLADRLAFAFRGYRLHPLGSASKIEKLAVEGTDSAHSDAPQPGELLPLHRSDTPLNLSWMHKGFDAAMVAFLECMRQLGRHVERGAAARRASGSSQGLHPQDVKMPYDISRDRINDCSIKCNGFVNDEGWTKACKHTLTYCKYLMAFTRDVRKPAAAGEGEGDGRE